MPNYAFNDLTITGSGGLVRDFLDRNQGRDRPLAFRAAVPYPEEYADQDRVRERFETDYPGAKPGEGPDSGYATGGRRWSFAHRATGADAMKTTRVSPYDIETGSVTVIFSTVWSPPLPWLREVSERWPKLAFDLSSMDHNAGYEIDVRFRGGTEVLHREREIAEWALPDSELPGDVWGPVWGDWTYMIGAVDPPNHAGGPCPSDGCEPRGSFEEKLERWATSSGRLLEAA